MATINLGAIKFNWKGAYNSGTSYAVDDVVSSSGNSYVCIQAHSNQAVGNATAYWNIMSSAGTNGSNGSNGTDLTTTLTAQGDIVYRNASGLARLPAGTANQLLKTGGSGANPSWTNAPVGGAKSFHEVARTSFLTSGTDSTWVQIMGGITMTPAGTDSKMALTFRSMLGVDKQSPGVHIKFTREISGGATTDLIGTMGKRQSQNVQSLWGSGEEVYPSSNIYVGMPINVMYVDQPNTTSAVTYKVWFYNGHGTSNITMGATYADGNNDEYPAVDTRMTLMEL
jgi:hypothetical protein